MAEVGVFTLILINTSLFATTAYPLQLSHSPRAKILAFNTNSTAALIVFYCILTKQ